MGFGRKRKQKHDLRSRKVTSSKAGLLSNLVRNDEMEMFQRREEIEKELMGSHISEVQVATPFLRYMGDKFTCEILEEEFSFYNSIRFRFVLKAICIAAMLWFVFYLAFIWASTTNMMTRAFYLGLIASLPCIYWLISSKFYTRYTQIIVGGLAMIIGLCLLAHKVQIRDFNNMVLSLFVIMLFTATPLVLNNAAAISGSVIIGFVCVGLYLIAVDDQQETISIRDMIILSLTNTVAYFFLLYVTYYRELNLRKTVITHHMLLAKASEVEIEAEKTHNLLRSMLPDVISEELRRREDKDKPFRIAEKFGSVTIMFVEVCHFNAISSEQTQDEVLDILNTVYSMFDSVLEDYDAYKVETVGQVYLVAGGCPHRTRRHPEDIGELALEFIALVPEINMILENTIPNFKRKLEIRIGLNTGSIVAGVVGQKSPRYKLFGDPVNTASRMQSTCPPGRIQCSQSTYNAMTEKFIFEHRGSISVKGKGEMSTYFLICRKDTIDQGRYAIKDSQEMKQHISNNHNVLFRRFTLDQSYSSSLLNVSFSSAKMKSNKVAPSNGFLFVDSDSSKIVGGVASLENLSGNHDFGGGDNIVLTSYGPASLCTWFISTIICYAKMFVMIFYIGNDEFRQFQFNRGLSNIAKFAHMLLIVLPILLVVELIAYTAVQSSTSTDKTGILESSTMLAMIGMTILMTVICGTIHNMCKYKRYQGFLRMAVVITFFILTACLILINIWSTHPNASFMMVCITIFFTLQVVPLSHRAVCSIIASIANCAVLAWALSVGAPDRYKRYTMEPGTDRFLNMHDVLLHFVLLIVSILLQLSSTVIQEIFLFQDFCSNKLVIDQNRILQNQKAQTTALLSQLLPPTIVPKLMEDNQLQTRIVDRFANVTILFTDMVNFTSFSRKISPLHLMDFLNVMYTRFDEITEKYELYKVEVIGDAYFIVGGCPVVSHDHTERVVKAAQEMLAVLPELCEVAHNILKAQQEQRRLKYEKEKLKLQFKRDDTNNNQDPETKTLIDKTPLAQLAKEEEEDLYGEIPVPDISIRIGVHVGSVVGGVVGFKDPRYHIFGDAVSLANMMEAKGKPGKVHVSQSTVDALTKGNKSAQSMFQIEPREPIDLSPVAGPQQTYFLSFK